MKPLPSDYKILKEIYNRYYDRFSDFENDGRDSKIHIGIDIVEVSKALKVEPDIVFGRLYYFLNKKYGYKTGDNTKVVLFDLEVGGVRHAVNFPLLGSVLSSMHEEQSKFAWATGSSIVAMVISILCAVITIA